LRLALEVFEVLFFDRAASLRRKSLLLFALRIIELRRNSIGGDIIPSFCALD
jgi:hypothetical protein